MRSLADLAAAAGIRIDPWYRAVAISCVTADSRRVRPGALFVALPGSSADGARFIGDAVSRGAAAVLAPRWMRLAGRRAGAGVPALRRAAPRAGTDCGCAGRPYAGQNCGGNGDERENQHG